MSIQCLRRMPGRDNFAPIGLLHSPPAASYDAMMGDRAATVHANHQVLSWLWVIAAVGLQLTFAASYVWLYLPRGIAAGPVLVPGGGGAGIVALITSSAIIAAGLMAVLFVLTCLLWHVTPRQTLLNGALLGIL